MASEPMGYLLQERARESAEAWAMMTPEGQREASTPPRLATCNGCGGLRRSRPDLPFFEDRGPDTRWASRCIHCLLDAGEHEGVHPFTVGHDFDPLGAWPTDLFYCGCRGYDA